MIKPFTPEEATNAVELPDYVIAAINELLAEKIINWSATLLQDEVIERILGKAPLGTTREFLFARKYLDIEKVYSRYGWSVTYDKPNYGDNYTPYWVFRRSR